ncbi:MAG TPA: hypothetical protein VHG70_16185 [Nocardioidaceae bacterium]|nr:hypothetical protein [Nocardioidaceae bacterium]
MKRHAWLWAPAAAAFLAAVLGIGVDATYGAQAGVDEPQYLLSALSLAEDGDLDISDELAAQRWRDFHADDLPVQTEPFPDGSEISPHDPLLPVLLAVPMGLWGWMGAKAALGLTAAACAALLSWTAVRRFGVSPRVAAVGSAVAFASPPLGVYSQQVYPEMPAALATLAAVALLTTSRLRSPHVVGVVAAVVALPWLGSKYVPVAMALAGLLLVRLLRTKGWRAVCGVAGALAVAGAGYLAVHRLVWGGWTVYASGDHFQQTGEFSVVGADPSYVGRSLRTVGLFVDQHYGLVPWQPAWLLLVPTVVALVVRRPAGWATLLAPLAAAWVTAVWVALTMHGFWSPGRQVVVVLPLAAVGILWLADRVLPRLRAWAAGLGLLGVAAQAALLVQGWQGTVTWVVHFREAYAPAYRLLGPLLPDYTGDGFWVLHLVWTAVLLAVALATVAALRRRPLRRDTRSGGEGDQRVLSH